MEARTADGREYLQPMLKSGLWVTNGVGMEIHITRFVSHFTFELIGKMWSVEFDGRHTLILSTRWEIQRLQGFCLWRDWAEEQSVGLRSHLLCFRFSCFTITYFSGLLALCSTASVYFHVFGTDGLYLGTWEIAYSQMTSQVSMPQVPSVSYWRVFSVW